MAPKDKEPADETPVPTSDERQVANLRQLVCDVVASATSSGDRRSFIDLLDYIDRDSLELPTMRPDGMSSIPTRTEILRLMVLQAVNIHRLGGLPKDFVSLIHRVAHAESSTFDIVGDPGIGFKIQFKSRKGGS